MIQPLRELLVNPPLENSRNEDETGRHNPVRQVQHFQPEPVANFADISRRLSQILKLEPGDVLPIKIPSHHRPRRRSSGADQSVRHSNGQYALRIEHLINPILNSLNQEQPNE
ncbi:hypothetical protein ACLK1T_24555 [Escherichia coli]